MSGYSIARYMVQSRCKSFNKLAWSYNLNGWAIFRGIISHDYMYVCKTLPSLCARHTVGGPGIWGHLGILVSWTISDRQEYWEHRDTSKYKYTMLTFLFIDVVTNMSTNKKKNIHIQIVPNPNVHCCVNFFSQMCKQWRRRSVHRYSTCQPKWAISVS